MKIKKYLLLLPIVALGLVGCTSETSEDPVDEPTPTEQEPTDTEPTDSDPVDQEPEVVKYSVTTSVAEGAEVVGLETEYEAGAAVTFTVTVTDKTKVVSQVDWNSTVIEADEQGVYSFTMPEVAVVVTVALGDAPTPWTDALGSTSNADLALNAQDENGTLAFDYDVPYADIGWSATYTSLTLSSVNLYVITTADEFSTKYNAYKEALDSSDYTVVETSTYSVYAENADGTIAIEFEGYQYSSTYYVDLYVYGLEGNFGTVISGTIGASTIEQYESNYNFTVTVSELSENYFPFVNNFVGYSGVSLSSSSAGYSWGLTMVSFNSNTYLSTYLAYLYSYVSPVYTDLGWTETSASGYYYWSKTIEGEEYNTTYVLIAQSSAFTGGTYGVCLYFSALSYASE